ncbi:uncharacterized protein LOC143043516 [Mytilus galloprovincialis]|uniref:uncharacterized protein LOC143043516 n=1 Tax=Mytilus galloprovincialis TaxID=29158 RepID=UPI003F7B489C
MLIKNLIRIHKHLTVRMQGTDNSDLLHPNTTSLIANAIRPYAIQNGTSDGGSFGMFPEITIEFHTNSMALAAICSCTSIVIVCIFLYCCCRASRRDGNYECSCAYERPTSHSTSSKRSSALISGSISIRIPTSESRYQPYKPTTDTIFEQSESEDSSAVNMTQKKTTSLDV